MTFRILFSLLIALASTPSFAKGDKKTPRLFDSKDVLQVEIKSNFPEVNRADADQAKIHSATLTYTEEGKKITLEVGLAARGGGRSYWCDFAPMRLILPEKQEGADGKKADPTDGTLFEHSKNKLRLVTHCDPNSFKNPEMSMDNFVVTEYMLYQVLEASGFPHLKTRLAYAHYVDSAGKPFATGYLIFLENAQDMAQRYGYHQAEGPEFRERLGTNGEIAFRMSLRLVASEVDHPYQVLGKNSFTIGERVSQEPLAFNPETMILVPYDFVYSPTHFPYSADRYGENKTSNAGWFKTFASQHENLRDDVRKNASLLLTNGEKIRKAIAAVPDPNPQDLKEKKRVIEWVEELLKDAQDYLAAP